MMPAFCTHYLFSRDIIADVDTDQLGFTINDVACAIGAQGPDIFFFGRLLPIFMPGRSLRRIGSAMHKAKPSELFDAFADYCAFSPNIDVAKSYIYGFIMHYSLDRTCHPFVYSFQQKILDRNPKLHSSAAHNKIEHSMDTYVLGKTFGIDDPSDFDSAATVTCDYDVADEIAHLLAFVVPRVTDYRLTEREARYALQDTVTMQKILRDRSGFFTFSARVAETLLGRAIRYYKFSSNINPKGLEKAENYVNIDNREWFSPYDPHTRRTESLPQLYMLAMDDCKRLINGFEQICMGRSSGREVTQNISFLTGTEV